MQQEGIAFPEKTCHNKKTTTEGEKNHDGQIRREENHRKIPFSGDSGGTHLPDLPAGDDSSLSDSADPGRAVANAFLDRVSQGRLPVSKCLGCLSKCKPAETPYCITDALVKAVTGDVENGLVFAGSNVGRIQGITTVGKLIEELKEGFEDELSL